MVVEWPLSFPADSSSAANWRICSFHRQLQQRRSHCRSPMTSDCRWSLVQTADPRLLTWTSSHEQLVPDVQASRHGKRSHRTSRQILPICKISCNYLPVVSIIDKQSIKGAMRARSITGWRKCPTGQKSLRIPPMPPLGWAPICRKSCLNKGLMSIFGRAAVGRKNMEVW